MKEKFRGKVWKFGDNINTDVITPGKYENLPMEEMILHCLEPVNPNFAGQVRENDILVAEENFGCGSAREIAPQALKHLKIGAVIAKSFSRTFFRNSIAIGLPVLVSKKAAALVAQGNVLEIDLEHSRVCNATSGGEIPIEPLHELLYEILMNGGIFLSFRDK
ncbi:MAG: 3-isopropylmalate dehydratase [Candidatus Aminicenantes bacterium]|nr:3-isopropylmalate dehydratase [Candidatus Aminicenantes bacterium]